MIRSFRSLAAVAAFSLFLCGFHVAEAHAAGHKVTATLTATPTTITLGQSSILSWSSSNATSCSGTNFSTSGATSGSIPVSPAATTLYSVVCSSHTGSAGASSTITVSSSSGNNLPRHFGIGLKDAQLELSWMTNSGVPWDYRNQYLNPGWESWNSPSGSFVLNYARQGYIPIFTWYEIGGGSWGNPGLGVFTSTGMQSANNMKGVFASFALAMQNASASGVSPIIFHIEPDLWGFMMQANGWNPASTLVSVASSGYPGLSGFANNAIGYAQALVYLRDTYAPNVLLAWNASLWGPNNGYDPTVTSPPSYATAQVTGTAVGDFYNALNAKFDMIFHDPSDADSAYKVAVRGTPSGKAWWSDAAFTDYLNYIAAVYVDTGLRSMLWQVPSGNTLYSSENNTTDHYQDNHAQYFLQSGNGYQSIRNFVAQGVIGLVFGFGGGTTDYMDYANDGITNPSPIIGNPFTTTPNNSLMATVADDDGGFLRSAAGAYYAAGSIPWQ